jgi:hypothetical protein
VNVGLLLNTDADISTPDASMRYLYVRSGVAGGVQVMRAVLNDISDAEISVEGGIVKVVGGGKTLNELLAYCVKTTLLEGSLTKLLDMSR